MVPSYLFLVNIKQFMRKINVASSILVLHIFLVKLFKIFFRPMLYCIL